MSEAGVFGASKAGAAADPMAYLRKPSVVFRIGALVSFPGPGEQQVITRSTGYSREREWEGSDAPATSEHLTLLINLFHCSRSLIKLNQNNAFLRVGVEIAKIRA